MSTAPSIASDRGFWLTTPVLKIRIGAPLAGSAMNAVTAAQSHTFVAEMFCFLFTLTSLLPFCAPVRRAHRDGFKNATDSNKRTWTQSTLGYLKNFFFVTFATSFANPEAAPIESPPNIPMTTFPSTSCS